MLQAKLSGKAGALASAIIVAVLFVLDMALFDSVMSVFTNDEDVRSEANSIKPLFSVANSFSCFALVAASIITGSGRPTLCAVAQGVSSWLIQAPLAYVLAFHTSLELEGVWVATVIGECLRVVVLTFFVFRLNWSMNSQSAAGRGANAFVEEGHIMDALHNNQTLVTIFGTVISPLNDVGRGQLYRQHAANDDHHLKTSCCFIGSSDVSGQWHHNDYLKVTSSSSSSSNSNFTDDFMMNNSCCKIHEHCKGYKLAGDPADDSYSINMELFDFAEENFSLHSKRNTDNIRAAVDASYDQQKQQLQQKEIVVQQQMALSNDSAASSAGSQLLQSDCAEAAYQPGCLSRASGNSEDSGVQDEGGIIAENADVIKFGSQMINGLSKLRRATS